MIIPIQIAEKLLLLAEQNIIPAGSARHALIEELVAEGIIERKGRIKKTLRMNDTEALNIFLQNKYSITDLIAYIQICKKEEVARNELVTVSSDSKLRRIRTFKGFLVNSYFPIKASIDDKQMIIHPVDGTFQFIYDFEKLKLPEDITIVGVENPENFRFIERQQYLFKNIQPLFVSRYPQNQSKDLIKFLQTIPNKYVHFGDFDFAGISIYQNEYKKYLFDKASFFIPGNITEMIEKFGNKNRYYSQKINFEIGLVSENEVLKLIDTIQQYKKGLDQEIFINAENKDGIT